MLQRRWRLAGLAAGALALVAACGSSPPASGPTAGTSSSAAAPAPASSAPPATLSPSPSPSTHAPTPTASSSGHGGGTDTVTKLLVVMVENHSLDQMRTGMPYTFGLARRYGYTTDYKAVTHPSLPNYLAIAGGQTYGVADDGPPSQHPLLGATVFGQALAAGRTAGLYAEGMPGNCALGDQGTYFVKHNPWAYFVPERDSCRRYDQPLAAIWPAIAGGRLPNAGMAVPDICHDAHDCGLSTADGWFRDLMQKVFAGPDWRSGHLAVVLTADEDDHNQDNTVLTVVIHPSQHGHVVSQPLDHYSLTRLYEDVLGVSYLHNAASAPSMTTAFGLRTG